ncbi:MAG: hypothetical protein NNA20_03060 [Nitrospira sp.]|nr:hypothetical protein [Nitrospira sp.]MCP9441550.1 hypothetical protein [Nitrospira sp.]
MIDVTTDEGRTVMIGIGVAGVALYLIARVIGFMILRRGERGHHQPTAQSPLTGGESTGQHDSERKTDRNKRDRQT